jgi:hypothetical protein
MYLVLLKFFWFISLCIMCFSLMIFQEGHGYIFWKLNLRFLVIFKSLELSWKIKLVGSLSCSRLIMAVSFVLQSLINFVRKMTQKDIQKLHISLSGMELQNGWTRCWWREIGVCLAGLDFFSYDPYYRHHFHRRYI